MSRGIKRIKETLDDFWFALMVKKTPLREENEFNTVLNELDIFLVCYAVISASFYKTMPLIINQYGYMVFFPMLLSGIMTCVTCFSYAELIALNPICGGAYEYVYYNIGELPAFLTGWSCLFISVLKVATTSNAIIGLIDENFLRSSIKKFLIRYMGLEIGYCDQFISTKTFVDIGSILPFLIITATSCLPLKYAKRNLNILSIVHIIIISICLCIFWFWMDLSQFNILHGTTDFRFFKEGARQGNFIFADYELPLYAGLETKNPKVDLPKGLIRGFGCGFIAYIVSTILYSIRMKYITQDSTGFVPTAAAIQELGLEPFDTLPVIGLIFCNFLSACARTYAATRLFYIMAKDGLLFPIFSKIHNKTRTPLIPTIIFAITSGIFIIFIDFRDTDKYAAMAMQSSIRILSLTNLLISRYQCNENNDDLGERWVLINYPNAVSSPTKITEKLSMKLIYISLMTIILANFILLYYIIREENSESFYKLILLVSIFTMFLSVYLLSRQPQNDRRKLYYRVRGVPITSFLAISWFVMVFMLNPEVTRVKFICWWLIGLVFYFSYGFWHSREYKRRKEELNQTMKQENSLLGSDTLKEREVETTTEIEKSKPSQSP